MKVDRALWFVHAMLIFSIMGSGVMAGYALTLAPVDLTHIVRLWPSALTFIASTSAVVTTGIMINKQKSAR